MLRMLDKYAIYASIKTKNALDTVFGKLEEIHYDEDGATTVEYIIAAAVLAGLAAWVFSKISDTVKGKANEAANIIGSAEFK